MSYGGWYAHHDGSSAEEQTIDWAYSQGVPVFMSAGNEGNKGRHFSGTVNANSESGFIQVNVSGAGINNTALYFNLVWADGSARNNLSLKYYNSNYNELTSVSQQTTVESLRGTESKYSNYGFYVPIGSSTFYLKVVNPSNVNQFFHIYDLWGAKVTFQNPDPAYTVGQPSTADHCLSVGAFTSRVNWTASNGNGYFFTGSGTLNDIAPFSSRGPRIDGLIKPNITAPGTAIISIRDRDVFTSSDPLWVDNEGVSGGPANYYVMQGTSMATPLAAGTAALILDKYPSSTPSMIYSALQNYSTSDVLTGAVPNNTWGYGKINIMEVMDNGDLPVELSSFTASVEMNIVILIWKTETEVNNYGFEIQKAIGKENGKWSDWIYNGFVNGNGNSNKPNDYSFIDETSLKTGKLKYRLKQIDTDGKFSYSTEVELKLQPELFSLNQNYPNPFNPTTTIEYSLPEESYVSISVYNLLGQEITKVVNEKLDAGYHQNIFSSEGLSSGIYFYSMTAKSVSGNNTFSNTKKMQLLK
jgi:subtilisin family serine protease